MLRQSNQMAADVCTIHQPEEKQKFIPFRDMSAKAVHSSFI
jgi:hypothetical protein